MAKNERPDGIVTDHHLGAHDGVQFMRPLAAAGVECPVIMVTASSDPAVRRRAREAGAARVFTPTDRDFVAYFRDCFAAREKNRP